MRRVSVWALVTMIGIVAVGCDLVPQPPKAHTSQEERGRHLLQIASGCGCHGQNFAGWKAGRPDSLPRSAPFGERFIGPFGVVPASNITPDPDTGISGWSDAMLEQAITEGIDPAGKRLSPVMPYHSYHGMAHSDVQSLIAYLHRLRPVKNEVPERTLKTPVPEPGTVPAAPDAPPSEPVALGNYLVNHVSACTDCHAADPDGPLTGKRMPIDGKSTLIPNLTPDRTTGIGSWSEADIARYLRTGARPDGGVAQSVMAGLIITSFSHFTPEEAHAVAAYLKSLPPAHLTAGTETK